MEPIQLGLQFKNDRDEVELGHYLKERGSTMLSTLGLASYALMRGRWPQTLYRCVRALKTVLAFQVLASQYSVFLRK